MAPVLPDTRLDTIQWFEARIADWTANAAAIGLTGEQVTAFSGQITTARTSYDAAQSARATSKAATTSFYNDTDAMRDTGADLIKAIKAFAATSDNPNVYALAQVPMPADPSPIGAPGQPTEVSISLTSSGYLSLKWKADNAAPSSGAYFVVQRKLAGETSFTTVGDTGEKSFVDASVPLGTTSAAYIITPRRGSQTGTASNQLIVQFGVGGAGGAGESSASLSIAA